MIEPIHLPAAAGATSGRRFALLHRPARPLRGLVVYAHPFAEEMNKSRRMAALAARALSEQGMAVLQPDLLGCGDSDGDFGDATWSAWVDDIVRASHWLRQHTSASLPLTLWGLRVGALLAAEAAAVLGNVQRLLLWQPTLNGKTALNQFLRLQVASELLGGPARSGAGTDTAKARLAAGESVELAGYRISPALADGLGHAQLRPVAGVQQLCWLELSSREGAATMTPASVSAQASWQQGGCDVQALAVTGPAFWQTTEIEDAPALVAATVDAMNTLLPSLQTAAA